jgi:hypothetical protein
VTPKELESYLREMTNRTSKLNQELKKFEVTKKIQVTHSSPNSNLYENEIYFALKSLNPILADMYAQVKLDLDNTERVSWAGTAHAIREIMLGILRMLAPDKDVMEQHGFVPEKGQEKPTHAQKATYILKQRNASSNEKSVVSEVENIDDWISKLVRATYTRASDAAHRRYDDKDETYRILQYFEAFAYDLLDIRAKGKK